MLLGRDDDPDTLKPDLNEGQQYRLLAEAAWKYLHVLYKGGPAIPREVINDRKSGHLTVEVYPLRLYVVRSSDPHKDDIIVRISCNVCSSLSHSALLQVMARHLMIAIIKCCSRERQHMHPGKCYSLPVILQLGCRLIWPRETLSWHCFMAQASVADLKAMACKACNVEEVDVQMWDYYLKSYAHRSTPLDENPDATLHNENLVNGQPIMLLERVRALLTFAVTLEAAGHLAGSQHSIDLGRCASSSVPISIRLITERRRTGTVQIAAKSHSNIILTHMWILSSMLLAECVHMLYLG